MNWWQTLRQSDRIIELSECVHALEISLAGKTRGEIEARREVALMEDELERERTKRIAMEAIASERRETIDTLKAELAEARETARQIMGERLKSLDAVNVKLMTERVEEKPVDFSQMSKAQTDMQAIGIQAIRKVRQIHSLVDEAVLSRLHPRFQKQPTGVVMNQPTEPNEAA